MNTVRYIYAEIFLAPAPGKPMRNAWLFWAIFGFAVAAGIGFLVLLGGAMPAALASPKATLPWPRPGSWLDRAMWIGCIPVWLATGLAGIKMMMAEWRGNGV